MSQGSVLVLDDNHVHARHISKMLEAERWTSVLAFDTAMAMSVLKSTRFHLLMFDAYVGQNSMLQIVGDIRASAKNTPLAILADSVNGSKAATHTVDQAKAMGVDFTLTKPFSPAALKTLLTDTASYHRMRKAQKSVLIIEDNVNLRRLITKVLGDMGYQIEAAEHMEDAFNRCQMGLVDVVVADIFMPGMGGIEGITRIRAQWPHIKVIAMSAGMDSKLDKHSVLAASRHVGALAQLAKPFVMEDLIHLVASVMSVESPPVCEVKKSVA